MPDLNPYTITAKKRNNKELAEPRVFDIKVSDRPGYNWRLDRRGQHHFKSKKSVKSHLQRIGFSDLED